MCALGCQLLPDSHFQLAYDLYSKAVEADGGKNAVYLANRAFAALKLEEYGQVIDDATAALAVDPTFFKAYWRRGVAKFALQKLDEAIEDFQKVVELRPEDPHAIAKLNECKKEWRRFGRHLSYVGSLCGKDWREGVG